MPEAYWNPVEHLQQSFLVIFPKELDHRCSTGEAGLGSKYASAYIYIQVSTIEIISIFNVFAANTLFLAKEEWNNVAVSELKEIS